jgi:hypothetical protein
MMFKNIAPLKMSSSVASDEIVTAIEAGDEDVISRLPAEVLLDIVSTLPIDEISRLCRTSRRLNELVCQSSEIWRHLFLRDISSLVVLPDHKYHQAYRNAEQLARRITCHRGNNHDTERFSQLIEHGYDKLFYRVMDRCLRSNPGWAISWNWVDSTLNQLIRLTIERHYETLTPELIRQYLDRYYFDTPRNYDQSRQVPSALVETHRYDLILDTVNDGVDINDYVKAAAKYGDVDTLQFLADQGVNLHDHADDILHAAVTSPPNVADRSDIIKFALNLGVTPEALGDAITDSAADERLSYLRLLLPLTQPGSPSFNEALYYAAQYGHRAIITFIVGLIDPSNITPQLQSGINRALRRAAKNSNPLNIVEILLPLADQSGLNRAFRNAYCANEIETAQLLLKTGAEIFPGVPTPSYHDEDEDEDEENERENESEEEDDD